MRRPAWSTLATAAAVAVAGLALASNLRAAPTNHWAANEFPNVPVTTQDGATVRFYDDLIGGGDLVGPDLAGVTDRRDRAWLDRYLREPDQVLAEGDPIASALDEKYHQIPMPNLGLDSEDVDAVLAYLEAQGGSAANAGTAAPSPG